jgi:hypothetical protein
MRKKMMPGQNGNDWPRLQKLFDQFAFSNHMAADWLADDEDIFEFCRNPTQYDWIYAGEKELLVPYGLTSGRLKVPQHPAGLSRSGTGMLRWEQRPVWIVDGTLRRGESNLLAKRRFYLDSHSWMILLGDGYNSSGVHVKYYMRYLQPEDYFNRDGQWYSVDTKNSFVPPT